MISISVEVGKWKGNMYDGSKSSSSGASCSWSSSDTLEGAGEGAVMGCDVALTGVEGVETGALGGGLGDLPRTALLSAAAFCSPLM